ncbi:HK97 gp10 family phage protein [Panacagrimonas sp.]|uniref:HK97 gp10 family phage protein n=1 Tax=Panacagrimonas sp. TaxID=2480088 RepID=UPI003B516D9F
MAAKKFNAAVDSWVRKSKARGQAIFQESVQRVIEQAQEQGPSVANPGGGGGKMPVDDGFLRASGQVSFSGMPSGPKRPAVGAAVYRFNADDVALSISRARLGDTIFFGWTAEYARAMEARYGFLRSAAQNWRPIVAAVTAEAKRRFP